METGEEGKKEELKIIQQMAKNGGHRAGLELASIVNRTDVAFATDATQLLFSSEG